MPVKVSTQLDDQDYQALQERAENAHLSEPLMAAYLLKNAVRMVPIQGSRAIILAGPVLDELEKRLGGMPVLHGKDLLQKIDHLAAISFEHIHLPFSPQQLNELQLRAERQGKTVEQLMEEAAPRIYEQMFDLLPR